MQELNMDVAALEREAPRAISRGIEVSVDSFDVFDTLIARRCIEPHRIFDLVAERAGLPQFPVARRLAEASVAHGPHDLATIYEALRSILGLTPEQAAVLRSLEIGVERENVIPVAENLRKVAHGDLLISDMYLDSETVRSLLDSAGLDKAVALIVTPDGKRSGSIWPLVLAKVDVKQHHGDNLHSDGAAPRRFGIATRHTDAAQPHAVERILIDAGLRDLAQICREARLSTWNDDPDLRALQLVEVGLNFPLLLIASIILARLVARQGHSSVLFSARDCNLWLPVFRVVARDLGLTVPTEYFFTSRIARTLPSEDYRAYAGERLGRGALVVDVCGTGWSLAHLFEKLGREDGQLFFLHVLPSVPLYERTAPTPAGCTIQGIVSGVRENLDHEVLEMCNYAEHGMVTDMRRVGPAFSPIFAPDPRPDHIRGAINVQRHAFLSAVDFLSKQGLRGIYGLNDATLSTLAEALYASLSQQHVLPGVFKAQHFAEDIATLKHLGCL